MKSTYRVFILLLGLSATAYAAGPSLDTDKAKVSYVMGFQVGSQLRQQGFDIDMETMTQAIQEGLSGAEPRLSGEQAAAVMKKFQEEQAAAKQKAGAENAAAGKAFLAENKNKPGVIELENGLQYKVIKEGTGIKPKETDTVSVHYRGTLIDGTEFDSSYKRNKPTSFPVNQVIPGWTQVLQMMKEGAKWQVYIPSDLAYGPRGAGAVIGPDSTLIFDIELIKVN
ncbi:MAG TPA: FKBP-type peptidyl-prolyl cis-trans isomerase [Sedimenticola sp.]|nr:FKBP-type peptidyl-prolyl cis-trans isomerase [Sedimenticola sp.]